MSSQVSAPVSTTVIAFDVSGQDLANVEAAASFDKIVAAARELGFVTQEEGRLNLTLTLAPDAAVGSTLQQVLVAVAEFDASATPLRVRAMVHHGVVFRTESVGQVSYVGSAIRSTQSALRRAPQNGHLMATRDFADYAAKLNDLPFRLEAMSGGAAADGTCNVVFYGKAEHAASSSRPGERLASADPAFVEFVTRRLAEEIGPFASALVERALRSAATATQLVPALSPDIDDLAARARFENDVQAYIASRAKN